MRRPLLAFALLLSMTTTAMTQTKSAGPDARGVAEAERAFARRSVEVGWREAFLEFFAEDAISYAPAPGNAKERLLKRPPTPQPQKVILDWWPVYADISQSGDMGLTTGPSLGYENTPERKAVFHGYYFSVWKKQRDGTWKVAIDVGVETPPPAASDSASSALLLGVPTAWKPKGAAADAGAELSALLGFEREAAGKLAGGDVAKTYGALLRADARLHRNGILPLAGRAAIVAHLSDKSRKLNWLPAAGDISRAADFAYTYGAYELTAKDASVEKGYYLHVWRRHARGPWQLAADVMHPAPPEKK